jgi:hypothetical protein
LAGQPKRKKVYQCSICKQSRQVKRNEDRKR